MPPKQTTEIKSSDKPEQSSPARAIMIKLGSIVTDVASGTKGMVTLLAIDIDNSRNYCFQPSGLDKETKQPLPAYWLVGARLKGGDRTPEPYIPIELLGTSVEDIATGFKGTAVTLVLFMSGCLHVTVQPKGQLEKGGMIKAFDFDIRRLEGPGIKKMTAAELEKDKLEKPSPMECPSRERSISRES